MENESKNIRVTFNIPEHIEDYITELYIHRLRKHKPDKQTRSRIICDAIRLLYEKEINS